MTEAGQRETPDQIQRQRESSAAPSSPLRQACDRFIPPSYPHPLPLKTHVFQTGHLNNSLRMNSLQISPINISGNRDPYFRPVLSPKSGISVPKTGFLPGNRSPAGGRPPASPTRRMMKLPPAIRPFMSFWGKMRRARTVRNARNRSRAQNSAAFHHRNAEKMVGTGRFELPTPRTPSECSTRLSHVPTQSSRLAESRLWGPEQFTLAIHLRAQSRGQARCFG